MTKNKKNIAITMMILSSLAFALMSVFVKLSGDLPATQKSIFRSIISMIISGSVFLFNIKSSSKKSISSYRALALRVIFGTIAIVLNYYSIDHLILSDADIIFRLSTVLVLILSWLFLGEQIRPIQLGATLLAFLGVSLVVKPEFSSEIFPYIIALSGALSTAIAYTALRALKDSTDANKIILVFSIATTTVLAPFVYFNYVTMTPAQWIYLILAGCFATVGQYCITFSYKYGPASQVSIYNYWGVIFTAILGMFFFKEFPDWISVIGYIIVFLSSFILFKTPSRKTKS